MAAHQAPEFRAMAQLDKLLDPFDAAARRRMLADAHNRIGVDPAPPSPPTVMGVLTACLAALDPLDESGRVQVVGALDSLAEGWRTAAAGQKPARASFDGGPHVPVGQADGRPVGVEP
jgi:hypothetical protein